MLDAFSRLYLPGSVALWVGLFFCLTSLWGYGQVARGREFDLRFARRAYRLFAVSLALAAGVLLTLFARRDFRLEVVAQYSGSELPLYYQIAAFWAGQKGSFLIWLLWGSLLGLLLYRSFRTPPAGDAGGFAARDEAAVMSVYTVSLLGLLLILVRESPFAMLAEGRADGEGLNPLLQDNWMVIHPPIMFVGYALTAVPFAFAVAAMWTRRFDRWAARAFPWALAGFLVLGTAILMGGYWAYKTLGWGGYWGWDPVENASLIPWIVTVILIHGLYMERARGSFRRSNLLFACLAYLSVLYGTFLTRSGVLADFSVHSFVDLGISGWLIGLMAFFVGLSAWLLATRWNSVPTRDLESPFWSRSAFLVLSTVTLTASMLAVLVGTSSPLLTGWFGSPSQVGPSFYNRVNLPVALLVGFLLALVPHLTWRAADPREVLRRLRWAIGLAAAGTVAGAVAGVRDPFHIAFVFLALLAMCSNLQRTIELARGAGLRRAGGYLAHVGVGIILLGILASSAYDEGGKVTLVQGQPVQVDGWTLTFERFVPRQGRTREAMEIRVVDAGGKTFLAYPKLFLNDRTSQLMVNPHIETIGRLGFADLYLSPLEFDPGQPAGAFETVELKKGEAKTVGEAVFRFVEFDLRAEGDALQAMASGQPVAIGAVVELERGGTTERLRPIYRFRSTGQVEAPPLDLPGGGTVLVGGIDASSGSVRLEIRDPRANRHVPPRLSLDVSRKPLIRLVWWGLYVVLAGGLLAFTRRLHSVQQTVPEAGG